MKKKLALLLGTFTLAISLTACGTDPQDTDYSGKSFSDLQSEMRSHISYVNGLSNGVSSIERTDDDSTDAKALQEYWESYYDYLGQSGYDVSADDLADMGIGTSDYEAAVKWADLVSEYGSLKTVVEESTETDEDSTEESTESTSSTEIYNFEDSFTVTQSGKTTTADATLIFVNEDNKETEVTFEVVYETWSMEITGISINPVQSLGQKMANAGLNTLISMVIVFLVLILISLIIYAFNIFPYIEKKKKEKAKRKAAEGLKAEENIPAQSSVEAETTQTDDLELVAVIAAAIAASEGCSTSDFVVRSINRR